MENNSINKIKNWYIISALILFIISVPLFTIPACNTFFDFSDTGQIGDTIGGITAPFISGLAAYLVFIAFKAQIKANEYIRKSNEYIKEQNSLTKIQFEYNYISQQIEKLKDTDFDKHYKYLNQYVVVTDFPYLEIPGYAEPTIRESLSKIFLILTEIMFIDEQFKKLGGNKQFIWNKFSIIIMTLFNDKCNNLRNWLQNADTDPDIIYNFTIGEMIGEINRISDEYGKHDNNSNYLFVTPEPE